MIPISKPFIGEAEKQAILEVLESGILVQGPRTTALEERFAALCGTKHAVAVSSGTAALHIALLAHGIGRGDEVITTPFTFIASANSILYAEARPVFVDIDEDTFNLDPALLESAITRRTKAIMPVHLYGYPCDMNAILEIAQKHKLIVVEDAAQAVGAMYKGKSVGSFGTGCFSLYATKNIMSGEGGIITTDDDAIAKRCRVLRSHGMEKRYQHDMLGYNFRMTDLQAAIGLAQMDRLDCFTARRRANADYLGANLTTVITPKVRTDYHHVWHQYTVRVRQDRDKAAVQLNQAGVGTGIFYPLPVHRQTYMREIIGEMSLPVAELLSSQVLSLPVHPLVSEADLQIIVTEVNKL